MSDRQPGNVVRFRAKPGKGDDLVKQAVEGFEVMKEKLDSWVIVQVDGDPDEIYVIEFFSDDESMARHRANNDEARQAHVAAMHSLMAEEAQPGGDDFSILTVRPSAASDDFPIRS